MKVLFIGSGHLYEFFINEYNNISSELKEFKVLSTYRSTPNKLRHDSFYFNTSDCSSEVLINSGADVIIWAIPPSLEVLNWLDKEGQSFQDCFHKIFHLHISSTGALKKSSRAQLLKDIEDSIACFDNSLILRVGGLIDEIRHPYGFFKNTKPQFDRGDMTKLVHTHDVARVIWWILNQENCDDFFTLSQKKLSFYAPKQYLKNEYYNKSIQIPSRVEDFSLAKIFKGFEFEIKDPWDLIKLS